MKNRRDEIKQRIAKRKKQKQLSRSTPSIERKTEFPASIYDDTDFAWIPPLGENRGKLHPLFNKDTFLLKMLTSAVLVLIVAILFQTPSAKLEGVRSVIVQVMEKEFQFASVTKWYEDIFGKPLALFPGGQKQQGNEKEYALPASAKILEDFNDENQGVTIQTEAGEEVVAIQEGTVLFAGVKKPYGKTVIIQHPDNSETWYGHLGEIYVDNYAKVEAGQKIGQVSTTGKGNAGKFYFAIKEGEKFIDPIQVIKFE